MNNAGKAKPIVNKKLKISSSFSYYVTKKVGKTIKKYRMIEDGDRIIVGVSGGKDSLTLLKLLNDRMGFYPCNYELMALHVVSNLPCEGLIDPSVIENYFKDNGYSYRLVKINLEVRDRNPGPYWCSRNRRRVLFDTANKLGYNKIALGHHRNDVIETLLLNMFYHAEVSTMLPVQELFNGKLSIIRPLYAIPESDTIKFARLNNFPNAHCRCSFDKETKREMFKRLINEIERTHPKAGLNALRSLENVNEKYLPLSVVKEDVVI